MNSIDNKGFGKTISFVLKVFFSFQFWLLVMKMTLCKTTNDREIVNRKWNENLQAFTRPCATPINVCGARKKIMYFL